MSMNREAMRAALQRGQYSHELLVACEMEGRRQRSEYLAAAIKRWGRRLGLWGFGTAAAKRPEPRVVACSADRATSEPPIAAAETPRRAA